MTRRRSLRRLTLAIGFALAEVLAGGSAMAQDAPVVLGGQKQHETFTLENIHTYADFLYRRTDDSIKPVNVPRQTFTQDHLEETFTLESTGYIYHPNLIDLNLNGTFGLTEDFINSSSGDDSGV